MNGSTIKSRNISKYTFKQMKMKHNNPKSVGHRKSNLKREIYSFTGLS